MGDRVPPLLTVEEAAKHLRIGRTKAYALATEWRATGGKSGLPVVDFGRVLRVPRHQLELLIGGPLEVELESVAPVAPANVEEPVEAPPETKSADASPTPAVRAPRGKRSRNRNNNDAQLSLIDLTSND